MLNGCGFHLACMDQERGSLGMTNKGHIAQQLQMPLVTVVVMILHDNWRYKGDKETSAVSRKKKN